MTLGDLALVDIAFAAVEDLVSDSFGDFVLPETAWVGTLFVTERTFSAIDGFRLGCAWVALAFSSCSFSTSRLRPFIFSSCASFAREACLAGVIRSGADGSGLFGTAFIPIGVGERRDVNPGEARRTFCVGALFGTPEGTLAIGALLGSYCCQYVSSTCSCPTTYQAFPACNACSPLHLSNNTCQLH